MPKMDGFKLATSITATETTYAPSELKKGNKKAETNCYIVAVTANYADDEQTLRKYRQSNISEVIQKPASLVRLRQIISKVMIYAPEESVSEE